MIRDMCNHLSKKSLLTRISNAMNMEEDMVIRSIVNFSDKNHYEETFHRTALAWANENDDPISVTDLLHLIKATHPSKEEGLRCIKQQITNDKLLFWITRTFSRFYPNSPGKMWSKAFIISFLTLGISYFGFIFDIYTDFQLTYDYSAAYSDIENYTSEMMQCARVNRSDPGNVTQDQAQSCFSFNDQYPQQTYIVAYWLTWSSMLVSLIAYVIGITFVFNMRNLTEKKFPKPGANATIIGKALWTIRQIFLWIVIRMFWPFFHLYRKLRYEGSEVKSSRRKKFIEFETIWIMVRTIEHGIEATVQLIIVLYLLVPYYDEIHDWDFQTTVKKTSSGIFHFLTLGNYPACLIEKIVGKLFMNVIAQSISLTLLKYLKYGMSLPDHLANMIPVFASNTLQIIARLYAMRVFFVIAEDLLRTNDNKGLAIGIGFCLHFLAVLLIKITFELRKENYQRGFWWNIKFCMKFTINLLSSCLLYVQTNEYGTKPRDNINQHNTFLPQLIFQIVILIEHLIVIIFPLGLVSNDCLDRETYINTAYFVPILWLISNISLIWHYKDCHTWSQTNGPSFRLFTVEQSQDPNEMINPPTTSPNCPEPEMSCFTFLCCQSVQIICSCSKRCVQINNQEKRKIYKSSDKIELNGMNSSTEPLILDKSISSTPE